MLQQIKNKIQERHQEAVQAGFDTFHDYRLSQCELLTSEMIGNIPKVQSKFQGQIILKSVEQVLAELFEFIYHKYNLTVTTEYITDGNIIMNYDLNLHNTCDGNWFDIDGIPNINIQHNFVLLANSQIINVWHEYGHLIDHFQQGIQNIKLDMLELTPQRMEIDCIKKYKLSIDFTKKYNHQHCLMMLDKYLTKQQDIQIEELKFIIRCQQLTEDDLAIITLGNYGGVYAGYQLTRYLISQEQQ